MTSLWMEETEIQSFPELTQDITADVAVVGGGMAGILTAHFLTEQGMQVVILEADKVGNGQTGKTTAKITSQHGVIYQKLLQKHGEEAAGKYSRENQKAIDRYEEIIHDRKIACGFVRCPAYLYTMETPDLLKEEAKSAAGWGLMPDLPEIQSFHFRCQVPYVLKIRPGFILFSFFSQWSADSPSMSIQECCRRRETDL